MALENELVAEAQTREDEIQTGQRRVREDSEWQTVQRRRFRGFAVRQGRQRRHPSQVLHKFNTVAEQTKTAGSFWEKHLVDSDKLETLDGAYKPGQETTLMASQFGVLPVADHNYSYAKTKLDQITLVGM